MLAEKGWNVVISPFNLPVNVTSQQNLRAESTNTDISTLKLRLCQPISTPEVINLRSISILNQQLRAEFTTQCIE